MKNLLSIIALFIVSTTYSQVADRLYKPNNTLVDTVNLGIVTVTTNPVGTQQPSMYSVNKSLLKWNTSQIRGLRDTILNINSSFGYVRTIDTASMLFPYLRKSNFTWNGLLGKPNFATVATSGNYNDLSNLPNLSLYYLASNPSGYLSSETDPTVPSYSKSLTGFSVIKTSTDPLYKSISYTPTSLEISTALGYTPYNGTVNPNGFISTEVDPVFLGSPSFGITNTLISNWNSSFSWGNHAGLYPLLSGNYSNPSWISSLAYSKITGVPSFLTTESDPIYSGSSWFATTNNSSDWNTAYNNRITSLTTTGSSGSSSLVSNILNIPTYTLTGLGGQAQLNGNGFVKMSGTTVSYDNSTYLTTSAASSTYQPIGSYELLSNKTSNFSTLDNTLYPTTQAVVNYVTGLGYLVSSRSLTINGVTQDLSANRSWTVGDLLSSGSYVDPSWITSLSWSKITGIPTTLGGYGITDGVTNSTLTASLAGKENNIALGTTGQYWRGDKTWQTLNTANVPENTNLYYTDIRSRSAIGLTTTGTSGIASYSNITGVLNIPDYSNTLTDNTVTRTINSSTYTISSTKPATVKYNIKITCTATIGSASSGKVLFQYSTNGGSTWVDAGEVENSNQVTLAVVLNSTTTQSGFIVWSVPANALCRLVPTSSGTTTITWVRGQETY